MFLHKLVSFSVWCPVQQVEQGALDLTFLNEFFAHIFHFNWYTLILQRVFTTGFWVFPGWVTLFSLIEPLPSPWLSTGWFSSLVLPKSSMYWERKIHPVVYQNYLHITSQQVEVALDLLGGSWPGWSHCCSHTSTHLCTGSVWHCLTLCDIECISAWSD